MLLHRQIALGQVCQLTRQEYLIHGYLVNIRGMARGALGLQTLLGRSILRRILEVCPQPVFTNPRGEKRTRRYIKSVVMYQQLFVRRFIVLVVFSFGNGNNQWLECFIHLAEAHAAKTYHAAVDVRVGSKRNDARKLTHDTHWARSGMKLLQEWTAFHGQINLTGDDMNIIQVGRPAVSRYHQHRKFFLTNMGVNYDVHDFPTSQFGLKLGGFMLLEEEAGAQANASGSDDEEMKIPPKEVVEEVAEELGLHLVWEDPNVNERANCNGPDANEDVDMDCT